jgi:hypothetical protein
MSLLQATAMLFIQPDRLWSRARRMAPHMATEYTMQALVDRNRELHTKSQQIAHTSLIPSFKRDMYFSKNLGHRDDWYHPGDSSMD